MASKVIALAAFALLCVYSAPLDATDVQILWTNGAALGLSTIVSAVDVSSSLTALVGSSSTDSAATIMMLSGSDIYNVLSEPTQSFSSSFSATQPLPSSFTQTPLSPSVTPPPSSSSVTETTTVLVTTTSWVTETVAPATVTYTASPTTVVEVISAGPSSSASPTIWVAPTQMSDLSAFDISHLADGANNLDIVTGIPANASATSLPLLAEAVETQSAGTAQSSWGNSSAVLQVFYPADSVNPSSNPLGGAEFYAQPLNLTDANNVSLSYSVFFPADFDWVEGGKLPGLYGGHTGCSGGNNATTCFSTRLMWRSGGAGELYLVSVLLFIIYVLNSCMVAQYAPKTKQTETLCRTPPESICDDEYGLSIGRGSFKFAAGAWTHVNQTVRLNTPGEQDGGFTLLVNGQEVISRSDVLYRDVVEAEAPPKPPDQTPPKAPQAQTPSSPPGILGGLGGLLGGVLGGLLGNILNTPWQQDSSVSITVDNATGIEDVTTLSPPGYSAATAVLDVFLYETAVTMTVTSTTTVPAATSTTTLQWRSTTTVFPTGLATSTGIADVFSLEGAPAPKPVGFIGLFFRWENSYYTLSFWEQSLVVDKCSTFFGGHEQNWATPKDQYSYFKDFAMSING